MDTVAKEHLSLELPAQPESVTTARHAAGDLARAIGADEMNVEIAVSEAVGNAVVHAYPRGAASAGAKVLISGERRGDTLELVVQDEGVGIRPDPLSPGLRLGLPLIGQVCDQVQVDTREGGTRLTMTFPAAA